ncbi:MAG: o-succinylbenzoate synthase [Muribaculaceae bacterium]|nr:o-succinylbenzoate synthase [Muribaculaceae bacterium]
MKAAYAPYRLNFITPGGTSRGVMNYKDTYFIKIWNEDYPELFGLGECPLFKGLSIEDDDTYEPKLNELCRNIENNIPTDLSAYSSIKFGLESAIYDYTNGCRRIYFHSDFTKGNCRIPINGLVWMGTKEQMLMRIDEKIKSGFKTLKLKIGAIDFSSELEMIDYIRCKFSPEQLEIRLDANGGFSIDNAMDRLTKLSLLDIHSIEQPIMAGQWNEMSYLCSNSPIPIALDEELIGITDLLVMNELLKTISPQYIILKPSLMGGLSGAEEWLKMAAQYNIGGWITSALESNVGLNTLAQWVAILQVKIPQGLGTGNLYSNNINSPLEQKEDYIFHNVNNKWALPDLNWSE